MHSLLIVLSLLAADPNPPKIHDDRLEIKLFAIDPQVTTPTGIAVDEKGIVYVVENNTHFRPKEYNRPELDRILRMQDTDGDGRADKVDEFYTGLRNTMSIAFEVDGSMLVATRMQIFRLRDKDGDGKAEERTDLVKLDTKGDYPHNGLSGFALDFSGNIYFGFGENLGADYKISGSDDKGLSGGSEGGNIYCCDPAGKNLRLVATGFWNPFHVTFDTYGRLFTVDNDPDSRPPCRLLHVVEGGDYGFRFRNGRKGVSPFTAWNGELPATLPMVAGTGEAPCAVMAYESDNLPAEYRGELLVTSWGDHRLERFTLQPRGASFSATMKPVVTGDQNFRPVGLALAPDGSLFMSDWVDKSYPIHGKGRIWHLRAKNPQKREPLSDDPALALAHPHRPWREAAARKLTREKAIEIATTDKNERARSAAAKQSFSDVPYLEGGQPAETIARLQPQLFVTLARFHELSLKEEQRKQLTPAEKAELERLGQKVVSDIGDLSKLADKPELLQAVIAVNAPLDMQQLPTATIYADPWLQLAAYRTFPPDLQNSIRTGKVSPLDIWEAAALQQVDAPNSRVIIPNLLDAANADLRFIGIRWAAESKLTDLVPKLEKQMEKEADNSRNFAALLLALDRLSGRNHENTGEYFAAKFLISNSKSVPAKIMALRMVSPNHADLSAKFLVDLSKQEDKTLQREAVRALRLRGGDEALARLREIASDETGDVQLRSEALLALSATDKQDRTLLLAIAHQAKNNPLRMESLRMLTGSELSEPETRDLLISMGQVDVRYSELLKRVLEPKTPATRPEPKDQAAWQKLTEGKGDPTVGERLFFHPKVASCFKCHEYKGRGGKIGPDLSTVAKSMTRERLLQSIVDPSREIAPQFTPWVIQAADGTVKTGVYVGEEIDGTVRYADSEGKIFKLHPRDVEDKKASEKSIMPEGLAATLTAQELRDLLEFLLQP
ncbi:PVC-type heme-binding CxxCH protein [Anatilimnocola floriformis]|uniref:PVC-type heme-binding CxxCH protein n=1 Tax=Anatilimnocola floriformis TaxID=2948575 RepID=UPI0020C594F7|nr:PVC-type heme-binding CxxCH protein [Anatilimnocola floriformis]